MKFQYTIVRFKILAIILSLFTTDISSAETLFNHTFFGKEKLIKEKKELKLFNCVHISGAGHVYLKQGNQPFLTIETNQKTLPNILSEVKGNCLLLSPKKHSSDFFVKYYVTAPVINEITTSGNIILESQGKLTTDMLTIMLSGSGNAHLKIKSNLLTTQISGNSHLIIEGQTTQQAIHISGSGLFDGKKLTTQKTTVSISGSGAATLRTQKELNANISGSGIVRYYGNPKITQYISGNGEIIPIE